MNSQRRRMAFLGAMIVSAVFAGCDKRSPAEPPKPAVADGAGAAASAASASQVTGVTPHPSDLPASANANGPADGATAVGGMSAQQDSGGAKRGSAPAPTAGDGAASASTPTPK